ncbi:hypothetical protein CI105_09290 [Candidatus Izimaplasma bacterium ZiA1]|nr:hypothetical protein CI105_09290 [Candidatus Izimaplasma bacterium ZiA1]
MIKEMKEELEEKKALISYDNTTLNANIPSGDVQSSFNYMRLLGPIDQVSYSQAAQDQGQYNFRIGDEISLKGLDIKGFVSMNDLTLAQQQNCRVGVRVMILRQKDENTDIGFVTNSHANQLLENGDLATPGPASFTGRPLNLIQSINRELYTVRYDKTLYLSQSLQSAGSATSNNGPVGPSLKFFQHKLTFGKRGLKLKFTDGNSDTPNNFPYVMVVGYSNLVDSAVATNGQINITMNSVATYTDS